MTQPNCPRCGEFCHIVYPVRGAYYGEAPACSSCGYNMVNHPRLAEQVGFDIEEYKRTRRRERRERGRDE